MLGQRCFQPFDRVEPAPLLGQFLGRVDREVYRASVSEAGGLATVAGFINEPRFSSVVIS
jgi:hypothetical protein